MASNPMQKKARNSFLLGMMLMLVIASVIIGFLFLQLNNSKKEEEKFESVKVYVLKQDIKSGEEITKDKLELVKVQKQVIPEKFKDPKTDPTGMKKGTPQQVVANDSINDTVYSALETNADMSSKSTNQIKKVAKTDLTAGTIITNNMLQDSDRNMTADLRLQEFNMIDIPSDLEEKDYIDIRLMLPSGQDYIVVSKKNITKSTQETIWIEMSEDEIVTMSNAIVEAYIMKGSRLYATRYVEPGMQTVATPTYPVSREVMELIAKNPNIEQEARSELYNRYNSNGQAEQRNNAINNTLNQYSEEAKSNIETNIEEQIKKSKEERKKYIEELNAAAAAATKATNTTSTNTSGTKTTKTTSK